MIKIGEKYVLKTDDLNIVLCEKYIGTRGKTKGKEVWKTLAYCSTVHNALLGLVEYHVRKTELKDVETVCQKVDELYALIKTLPNISKTLLEMP